VCCVTIDRLQLLLCAFYTTLVGRVAVEQCVQLLWLSQQDENDNWPS